MTHHLNNTLNGSLSVRNLIPGTKCNHTGKPLLHTHTQKKTTQHLTKTAKFIKTDDEFNPKTRLFTRNSIQHRRKDQFLNEHRDQL